MTTTIDRRSVLLGSASVAATLAIGDDQLSHEELRLLAMSVGVPSSMEDYNRTRTFAPGSDQKKMIDSLTDRGFFTQTENSSPNADCDYFVVPTEKGLAALRAAGVDV